MSNFTNSQNSRAMNTSWRNRSYSLGSKPCISSRGTTSSNTVNNSNTNQPNLRQRSGSVTNSSHSSGSESGVHNSRQRNPRPYFTPRLSSDSSSDGGSLWPKKDRRHTTSYRQRNGQKMANTWSRDSNQSNSETTSSTESGVFSGDSSFGNINPVNCISSRNDHRNHLNFPQNRNGRGFSKYPPGMPIPTPATHFASSENFNAPAPSSLPQPPQIWLFGRAEAQDKEEDLEEERVQEKNLNTFDYYNLKMLLTVKA
ncbi:ras guanine nucleotide exchange factor G-like [Zeugodacus cucurbitae]|uniref:ras guanine nucleotide exchange factor G-like n=1 Tax=Zeugodacus cucurbitae TaxID=28588 RepID=UPI0023D94C08|nr:ras guanine nucleotide exchange factor G-like [Zeugodacus cucurbitae]